MATHLATGSSRGLGLGLVKQLGLMPPQNVGTIFATWAVWCLSSVDEAFLQVKSLLGDRGLDVLINNAGIMNWATEPIDKMTDLESTFTANVTSVHNVTAAFLPLLHRGTLKKVFNISTTVGSIGMSPKFMVFNIPAYKVSEAALNMLTVQYALSYVDAGFTFITISPGWLKTDLGGSNADLTVETEAKAILETTQL